ncbi:MAG: phospholipase D-like domain-containing protein [Cellulosilyticaceae bacterium]
MEYYFSHSTPLDEKLIIQINQAKSTLDIAIYTITKKEIVNAIIAAKERGVTVRLICDKEQIHTPAEHDDILNFQSHQIPIKINSHAGLMHLKITIIDHTTILFGSYNYTKAATLLNDELLVLLDDALIAKDFSQQFETMWQDQKHFIALV